MNRHRQSAFTLIELLVVIAIIAILAAILFPVFAQAKLAAKKAAGLSNVKQIGIAFNLYLQDSDDVLPGYRFSVANSAAPINPFYLSLPAGDARKATLDSSGQSTIHAVFFNQLLQPYTKNDELFKSKEYPNAWVNFQDKRLPPDANFHSYGGQNSYAVNGYLFKSNAGFSATAVENTSNTLAMIDATYYSAFPAQPTTGWCTLNDYTPTPPLGTYDHYWKHLGNNELDFNNKGNPNPDDASNAATIKKIESRYGGVLNVVRVDSSAKSYPAKAVIYDLRNKGVDSMWNPRKEACQ